MIFVEPSSARWWTTTYLPTSTTGCPPAGSMPRV
jgi:hypothetical protein